MAEGGQIRDDDWNNYWIAAAGMETSSPLALQLFDQCLSSGIDDELQNNNNNNNNSSSSGAIAPEGMNNNIWCDDGVIRPPLPLRLFPEEEEDLETNRWGIQNKSNSGNAPLHPPSLLRLPEEPLPSSSSSSLPPLPPLLRLPKNPNNFHHQDGKSLRINLARFHYLKG